MDLAQKRCIPCEKGTMPLTIQEVEMLRKDVPAWSRTSDARKISRTFQFKDFVKALAFVNKVGMIAEAEGHHPDIALSWGKVSLTLYTHAIGGLSENDVILAAKVDQI